MKTRGIITSLATFAAIAGLNSSYAGESYSTKFGQEEYPTGFLYSMNTVKKEGNFRLKITSPEVREVPLAERSNLVSRIDKAMNVYDSEKLKKLGLTFYVMETLAPSRDPKNAGNLRDIPYNLKFHGKSINTVTTNNLEETLHKAVFLTYFNNLSEEKREEIRKTYEDSRPSAVEKAIALETGKWNCHIAQRYSDIVLGKVTPTVNDAKLVEIQNSLKKK